MSTIRATYVQHGSSSVPNITLNASGQVIVASGIVSSGTFAAPTGSASAPGVYFVGDTNTGIYSPGADQVAISTNGTGRLFVNSSGNVAIGTNNPNVRLTVISTGTVNGVSNATFRSSDDINNSLTIGHAAGVASIACDQAIGFGSNAGGVYSERLRITSDGKLGLGTSSPNFSTSIYGATNSYTQYINALSGSTSSDGLLVGLDEAGSAVLRYRESGSLIFYTSDAERMRIDSSGRLGVGTTTFTTDCKLSIGSGALNFIGNSTAPNASTFIYRPADNSLGLGTDGVERCRLDSSGRLLVGTSTASVAAGKNSYFQVVGTGQESSSAQITRFSSDNNAPSLVFGKANGAAATNSVSSGTQLGRIEFAGSDGTDINSIAARIDSYVDGTPGANDMPGRLVFSTTADGASSPTERMRITNDGAALIGSSSSSLNTSTDKVKFAVGGTGNNHTPTRGIWMSGTIPASTTYTVDLGPNQPSGFLVLTIASDIYAPNEPWTATNTQTQLYLVIPLRSGAAGGSKTLVSSISRGTPHGTIVWTDDGTKFTIENTSGSAPLWYEVQYRI